MAAMTESIAILVGVLPAQVSVTLTAGRRLASATPTPAAHLDASGARGLTAVSGRVQVYYEISTHSNPGAPPTTDSDIIASIVDTNSASVFQEILSSKLADDGVGYELIVESFTVLQGTTSDEYTIGEDAMAHTPEEFSEASVPFHVVVIIGGVSLAICIGIIANFIACRVLRPRRRSVVVTAADVEDDSQHVPDVMQFWFLPVREIKHVRGHLPPHQVLRERNVLVKRDMRIEDVIGGKFVADTVAVSHRWLTPEHFDPDCIKLEKLQEVLEGLPHIEYVWIDWACVPQKYFFELNAEETEECDLVWANVLPFIFLGCSVIVLYERGCSDEFWPNAECWIATKMPTQSGLVPASAGALRVKFYGILSQSGQDEGVTEFMMYVWHKHLTPTAISMLEQDGVIAEARDKSISLKVLACLDDRVKQHFESAEDPVLSL